MTREIEFVDGNTDTVVSRVPSDEVPPANRALYLRQGVQVSGPEEADEVVPIVRVVRFTVDDAGQPVEAERATRAYIREFDEQGVMRRETVQVRNG